MEKYSNHSFVFNDFDGMPLRVTFLGGKWWVTTPGEQLQPLEEFLDEGIGYRFLCDEGGRVDTLVLAKMLGKALEEPEMSVEETLRERMVSLRRLGVALDLSEHLELTCEVFSNCSMHRQGMYSVWCYCGDSPLDMVFDIDNFDTVAEALDWVQCYFDFLRDLGINISVTHIQSRI